MHRKYPQSQGWDVAEVQRADLIDAVQSLFHLTMAANTEDGIYHPPEPYGRPGDAERRATQERIRVKREASMRSLVEQLLPPERR